MHSMNTPHRIISTFNNLDMIGFVHNVEGTDFYQCGTASGPLAPAFRDGGAIAPGSMLKLAFNYDTDEYASRTGGWFCEVVRINRKSITVRSTDTGKTHRIEL